MAKTSQEKSMERMPTAPDGWETHEHTSKTRNYVEKPLTSKTRWRRRRKKKGREGGLGGNKKNKNA
ncbi:hypothetical protein CsSME_00004921 [Camellia sinensis var. sinensis]